MESFSGKIQGVLVNEEILLNSILAKYPKYFNILRLNYFTISNNVNLCVFPLSGSYNCWIYPCSQSPGLVHILVEEMLLHCKVISAEYDQGLQSQIC